jgi:hypothetical protein
MHIYGRDAKIIGAGPETNTDRLYYMRIVNVVKDTLHGCI